MWRVFDRYFEPMWLACWLVIAGCGAFTALAREDSPLFIYVDAAVLFAWMFWVALLGLRWRDA